ncbi:MAG TPA: PilZ domain-containing protein [Vicinamibacterales bacterium]|nr:PilZ domain-containing protein [Vicinamibacterales bacterium]
MYSPPRKRRYPVNWPLQYRRINDVEWRPGRTINMSVSGILFEAQEPLKHDEAVELLIVFEATNRHIPSSMVTTSGSVVRTEPKVPAVIAVKFAS